MNEEIILSVDRVKAAYGQSTILWSVDMQVKKAAVTTVMGRNGVGKSTLLKTIMGLVKTQEGNIDFNGTSIVNQASYKIAKAGVGYVPQGREIIPKLTVRENLLLGLEATADYKAKMTEEEIYDLFPVLQEFRKRLGGNLSGGQQQQLAIARTLISAPKLLLLDEPTEGIQPSIAYEIGDIIRRLVSEKNLSVLLVEQKIDFAKHVSDHFYLMDRGKMIKNGVAGLFDFGELQEHIAV
ncbi:urea ABC transporter ATP-binding subunit UrtE [Sphingobacterium phlebotomi]|uniref:urea ABC transporter ATP-binding subunit UrtE n=1 Tax=Sphingobacterium phlebotomi TaxID=2605433 RepID=UPI001CA36756|nr:urea ABC transporter ATP-binding subunit UrtE [Sphingobacterium phlebotomi]